MPHACSPVKQDGRPISTHELERLALFPRSGLNAYLDWQTRFIKILAFKTAKVARISELI